jgi:hypothetical protein
MSDVTQHDVESEDPTTTPEAAPNDDTPLRSPRLRVGGVVQAMGLILLIGLPLAGVFWLLERSSDDGALFACRGTVIYKGQPVTSGYLLTGRRNANAQELGAIGVIDKNGHFELTTNGEVGARLGQHQVAVMVFLAAPIPQPLVPRHYTDLKTSGLTIEVTADTEKNSFDLVLKDDSSTNSDGSANKSTEPRNN